MRFFLSLRILLLALATLGYSANGAQAHVQISAGETLELMLCGTGATKSVALHIPGEPMQETEDTCCGDCATPTGMTPPKIDLVARVLIFSVPEPANLPEAISPRSPLWAGAPPHGPPHTHEA